MTRSGLTLIELLVVMLIVGILAIIAMPRYFDFRDRAFISVMQADLGQLRAAQERFYQENNFVYADDVADLIAADLFMGSPDVTVVVNNANVTNWDATASHSSTAVVCDYDSSVGVIDCG